MENVMAKVVLDQAIEPNFAVPEPDLTPEIMIQRSIDLIPLVAEHSAEAEKLGRPTEIVHEAFEKAGFYRILQPRKYGGYEFDVETLYKITMNIARGCASTAWCFSFSHGHTIELASFFPEETQAELYGPNGDFRAPFYGGVPGTGKKVEGGYMVEGKWPFCSGSPYSTHMVGHFMLTDDKGEGVAVRMFIIPRESYTILDDWRGNQHGMSATGSNSILVENIFVPDHHTIDQSMLDLRVDGGTIGTALHGNPMYGMPVIGFMAGYYAAVAVGACWGGLDAYEADIRSRRMAINPVEAKIRKSGSDDAEKDVTLPFRYQDEGYQRCYGRAYADLMAAEAIVMTSARRAKEASIRNLETDGYPMGFDTEQLTLAQTATKLARDSFDYNLWRMVGAPATRPGTRMNRIQRDLSVVGNHNAIGFAETAWVILGKQKLGCFGPAPTPDAPAV